MVEPPKDTRVTLAEEKGWGESRSNYNNEFTWNVLYALYAVAEEAEKTPAQVALNWLLERPGVTAPIIGASGWSLTTDQMQRLNQASTLPVSYPYDQAAEQQQRAGRA